MTYNLPGLSIPNFLHLPAFLQGIPIFPIILALFFVFYAISSAMLIYHWSAYGMKSVKVKAAQAIFLVVSVVLFGGAVITMQYI